MLFSTGYSSEIGQITMASDGKSLVGLWIEGQKYFVGISGSMQEKADLNIFYNTKTWLDRYFDGLKPDISEISLAPIGGEFRKAVWAILCSIPYGEVITYGDIAKKMAEKMNRSHMSAQAIGGAVGHNPISIIIPCHRVVGTKGNLTGYAGGIDKKIKLLEHEGLDMSNFYVPSKGTAL
ncbi:MAG: methylated-DNA--[protein]-cysteine S-methyltransferase [Clostridiaceae bacterium]|nr:methylated-DNA--[protein]-cysteine S-methyltransferase [Clostridiaceae bacterium]